MNKKNRVHKKEKKILDTIEVKKDLGTVIGIDLGTTYSCVAVFKSCHVEVIENEQGNRITPSYVTFTSNGERLVGDAAKNLLTSNPQSMFMSIVRRVVFIFYCSIIKIQYFI